MSLTFVSHLSIGGVWFAYIVCLIVILMLILTSLPTLFLISGLSRAEVPNEIEVVKNTSISKKYKLMVTSISEMYIGGKLMFRKRYDLVEKFLSWRSINW